MDTITTSMGSARMAQKCFGGALKKHPHVTDAFGPTLTAHSTPSRTHTLAILGRGQSKEQVIKSINTGLFALIKP